MSFTRSKVYIAYIVIIIGLLALISISSIVSIRNMEKQNASIVEKAIPISNATHGLLTNLINQETGVRGYEVTGDQSYLEPYYSGQAQLAKDIEALRLYENTYPNLRQLVEVEALPIIATLQEHYSTQITLVQAGKTDEAIRKIDNGKRLMDQFRNVHGKIIADVQRITDEAHRSTQFAGQLSRAITLASGVIAVIAGLMSALAFSRAARAEAQLRKSEETYRYMAESLEAQNEEIVAQQEQQEITLAQLSNREHELEVISSYQEKLTGSTELKEFLKCSVPALLDSLKLDAALVVMERGEDEDRLYEVIYSCGYPRDYTYRAEKELFGVSRRIFDENNSFVRRRECTAAEKGLHQGLLFAVDQYFPLTDNAQNVIGFLLLTHYPFSSIEEGNPLLTKGLVRQFNIAFYAQFVSEERRKQAHYMEELNNQILLEKKQIEEQRDLIESILEASREGMMMCDSDGIVLFSNQQMSRYFGLHLAVNRDLRILVQGLAEESPSFSTIAAMTDSMIDGRLSHFAQRFSFGSTEQQEHAEIYATIVGEGTEQKGYLFVFRDRTEEERVDEMKNEFISIVSHELRTPLASVLGFIEILLHRELPPDKQKKYMDTIYKEALRLTSLINDFLDLQRMESGKQIYHFAPVNLVDTLQEVIEQWQDKQNHRIVMHYEQPELWVRGDADRIRQMAHNLLSNAIKYSPGAERIDIRLDRQRNRVLLSIQDYGLGIPEDAKELMFSKFFRVDNSDRRQIGGTGLGLSIVKEIVEAHEGHISFVSAMGEGTTFTVELMAYELAALDGNIVIFEDDPNLAKLMEVALHKLKHPSTVIHSAEEGILALQRSNGEGALLFIVDIYLEGSQTGWDFLTELYRHPVHSRTPVIVSTALDPPQDYHEKDSERFLKKPFTMERLVQVAEQLIERKRSIS